MSSRLTSMKTLLVARVGDNGAGKSTLINAIAGVRALPAAVVAA